MAASIVSRLADIEEKIDATAGKVDSDSGASPALKAVFDELHRKTREARDDLSGADGPTIRERIFEVEEAADCAKRAVEAESRLSEETRSAVLQIHDALCSMKSEVAG